MGIYRTAKQLLHALIWTKRHLTGQLNVDEISAITRFVRPDEICLDIAAHAGSWTRALSKMVNRGGHVYAFEALPYYAQVLKHTVTLLGLKNVTVINQAVTDHNNEVKLIWRDADGKHLTGMTHVAGLAEETQEPITVSSTTLDSFIASRNIRSRVAFAKGDIEGCELMVLHGASKMIDLFRPVFYMEVLAEHCCRYSCQFSDLFDFFEARRYRAYTITNNDLVVTNKRVYCGLGDVLYIPSK